MARQDSRCAAPAYREGSHVPGRAAVQSSHPGATASDVTRLAHHLGATASYARTLGAHAIKLGAGADLLVGRTTYVAYGRDDDAGALDPALTVRGVDRTSALTTGAYAQDRITTGRWVIDAGVRVDELHVSLDGGGTDDALGVSPRLGAAFAPTKDAVVHAFAGVLWQPPAPLDAASAARALGAVPPGQVVRYDLRPETSAYGELGAAARLAGALRGGLTAWGRYAWNQLDDTAVGATSLLSNYNFARGRAAGLEATLDLRVGPWLSAFANGSLGLAQGQEIRSARYLFGADDLASAAWQTLDHAQTLTANLGATVREGRFTLTGVASYGSGLRTGPANTDHVPGHVHADVSMQYTFVSHGYPIRVATDVVNVLDARYAYRIANGFVGSAYAAPRREGSARNDARRNHFVFGGGAVFFRVTGGASFAPDLPSCALVPANASRGSGSIPGVGRDPGWAIASAGTSDMIRDKTRARG